MKIVIDASNHILGRLSSEIAKNLLEGKDITVINAEKIIVSGNPKTVIDRFRRKVKRGNPHHGPFYPKTPTGILKRSVRGMLPYKKTKGREALKRLTIHSGNPENIKGEKIEKAQNNLECRYITLEELCKKI